MTHGSEQETPFEPLHVVIFRHANAVMKTHPDGAKARAAMAQVPAAIRDEVAAHVRRQWRLWQTSNFILPWCEARKDDAT